MANSFGNHLKISLFGESHGEAMGVVIDGLPSGFKIDSEKIQLALERRRPDGIFTSTRVEQDDYSILSGYFNAHTTGTPLAIFVPNHNKNSKDYDPNLLRPSTADLSAYEKYKGFQDFRGSGHFSGRVTAPLVIAGEICRQILSKKQIIIASHLLQLKDIHDSSFTTIKSELPSLLAHLNHQKMPLIQEEKRSEIEAMIIKAKEAKDSVGGIIEIMVHNFPSGIGEPFFDSIESHLSKILFSIPAVKGVEFGLGFDFANYYGSEVKDELYYDASIKTYTNHNGGINGGISNGMDLLFKTVLKPTPSIGQVQKSVNYNSKEAIDLTIKGRHDPCIVARACVIIESVTAIALLDLLLQHCGIKWIYEE